MSIELLEAVAGEGDGTKSVASALSDKVEGAGAAIDGVDVDGAESKFDEDGIPTLSVCQLPRGRTHRSENRRLILLGRLRFHEKFV